MKIEKASAAAPNIMTGKFIVKKMNSEDYTYWYESTACPCSAGSGAPVFLNATETAPQPTGQVLQTPVTPKTVDLVSPVKELFINAFPNPFVNTATINFILPEYSANVKLSIFNLEGRDVKQLYDGAAEANVEYQFKVNADNNMDAGIYFYRLETKEGKVAVNKLILLK